MILREYNGLPIAILLHISNTGIQNQKEVFIALMTETRYEGISLAKSAYKGFYLKQVMQLNHKSYLM